MTKHTWKYLPWALMPLLLAGACDWLWPLEGEYDPHRCDPQCTGSQICRQGQCLGPGSDGPGELDNGPTKKDGPSPKKDLKPRPHKDVGQTKRDGVKPVADKTVPTPDKTVPSPDQAPTCSSGALLCLGGDNIKYCDKGVWKNTTCTVHCKAGGYDYAVNCAVGLGGSSCVCAKKAGYGTVCTSNATCGLTYYCRLPVTWMAGVCTKVCQKDVDCVGGPPGTLAKCNIINVTPFGPIRNCEFVCGTYNKPCPANMACDTTTNLCLPNKLPPP